MKKTYSFDIFDTCLVRKCGCPDNLFRLWADRALGEVDLSYLKELVNSRLNAEKMARKELGKEDVNLITCHLGNGSSIFAIKDGKCYDTSLGFSTNSGLVMGTRCGDIDAFLIPYIMRETGKSLDEVVNILNKESGLLGVSGVSSDSRDIEDGIKAGNERCILAQKLFVNRVVGYIAKLWCELQDVDAICFAGGIGENSIMTRKQIIDKLAPLGITLDEEANDIRGEFRLITKEGSKIPCYIVPTDEELMIARDTYRLIG